MKRKGNWMNKILLKKYCLFLAIFMVFMCSKTIFAKEVADVSEQTFTPTVLTKEITSRTTSIKVYVYKDTTLYIENSSGVVFEKFYKKEGMKKISFGKQKGGTTLKFYLVYKHSGKQGDVVNKKVVDLPEIATEKVGKIKTPGVQKNITNKTTTIKVQGYKNTTLIIKNDKKTVKKVDFKKNQSKNITIPAQKSGKLYFYLKKGKSRSKIISRNVKDVIAPAKPKVSINGSELVVKGEVGTKVYLKNGKGNWTYKGVILEKKGLAILRMSLTEEASYYCVKLKDGSGNYSKSSKIKDPTLGEDLTAID